MRALALLVLLTGVVLAGDSRAVELAKLRREVETSSAELALRKEDLRGRLRAIDAQKVEIEVQIRREELRLAQIDGEGEARRVELAEHATRVDTLNPVVLVSIARIRAAVVAGLPFRVADRTAELDTLRDQLESGRVGSESATARLWAFTEDELRLARENALDRQIVVLDGTDVLADVARLGMVALYFRTDGGRSGVARPGEGGWTWTTFGARDDQKAVETLFEKMRHGVRSGVFTLPNPRAAP